MEEHPEEAATNNVLGTLNVMNTAVRYRTDRPVRFDVHARLLHGNRLRMRREVTPVQTEGQGPMNRMSPSRAKATLSRVVLSAMSIAVALA